MLVDNVVGSVDVSSVKPVSKRATPGDSIERRLLDPQVASDTKQLFPAAAMNAIVRFGGPAITATQSYAMDSGKVLDVTGDFNGKKKNSQGL